MRYQCAAIDDTTLVDGVATLIRVQNCPGGGTCNHTVPESGDYSQAEVWVNSITMLQWHLVAQGIGRAIYTVATKTASYEGV